MDILTSEEFLFVSQTLRRMDNKLVKLKRVKGRSKEGLISNF